MSEIAKSSVPRVSLWMGAARRALAVELTARLSGGQTFTGAAGGAQAFALGIGGAEAGAWMREDDGGLHWAEPLGDDLRAALAGAAPGVFFIADLGAFGTAADPALRLADFDLLANCRTRGVRVATLEPLPASLIELMETGPADAGAQGPILLGSVGTLRRSEERGTLWSTPLPCARMLRGVRAALDVRDSLGAVRAVSIECLGRPEHGTLGTRLLDGLDLIHLFLGEPDTLEAHASAPAEPGVRATPGDTLRGLDGDISALLRFGGGKSATLFASCRAGAFAIRATVLGAHGSITVSDAEFAWRDASGKVLETFQSVAMEPRLRREDAPRRLSAGSGGAGGAAGAATPSPAGAAAKKRQRTKKGSAAEPMLLSPESLSAALGVAPPPPPVKAVESGERVDQRFAALLAEQLRIAANESGGATLIPTSGGASGAMVLAMAQAALLSCRTGEGESPATMLRIAGG
ncbi:hypothetical protein BH11PLA1_BH11PLA1_10750 [soil metagenome]